MADQDDQLMTTAEVADMAKVTAMAVRLWEQKGIGPRPVRPAGTRIVRYRRREIVAWLQGDSPNAEAAS